jgi:hypothetical protein
MNSASAHHDPRPLATADFNIFRHVFSIILLCIFHPPFLTLLHQSDGEAGELKKGRIQSGQRILVQQE